jgi:hypothetical protein
MCALSRPLVLLYSVTVRLSESMRYFALPNTDHTTVFTPYYQYPGDRAIFLADALRIFAVRQIWIFIHTGQYT